MENTTAENLVNRIWDIVRDRISRRNTYIPLEQIHAFQPSTGLYRAANGNLTMQWWDTLLGL